MPAPIPGIVLGRLAVDLTEQRSGQGSAWLRDAIRVHAISEDAATFYLRHGCVQSPTSGLTLMLLINTIRKSVS